MNKSNFTEIRVKDIPCLSFLKGTKYNLYVGPKLFWWQLFKLRKFSFLYRIVYLPDYFKKLSKKSLNYNFPGIVFPKRFSAEIFYDSIRESLGHDISHKSKFFIRYDGEEFVALFGTTDLDYAIEYLFHRGFDFKQTQNNQEDVEYLVNEYLEFDDGTQEDSTKTLTEDSDIRFRIVSEEEPDTDDGILYRRGDLVTDSKISPKSKNKEECLANASAIDEVANGDIDQMAEDVRHAIEALLMTGFSKEIIKSWLKEDVKLSRLRVTRQYKILLVDYNIAIKMGPLPKTVFLFYLRHPEGVRFSYLQDHVKELMHIYERVSVNDDPQKMQESIAALTNPLSNSINEKCAAIKRAFLLQVNDDVAKNYYVTGMQGGAKGIILDRNLVEWECKL